MQQKLLPFHIKNRREISFSQPLNRNQQQNYQQQPIQFYQQGNPKITNKQSNFTPNKLSSNNQAIYSAYQEQSNQYNQNKIVYKNLSAKIQRNKPFYELLNNKQNIFQNEKIKQQKLNCSFQKIDLISSINIINDKIKHILKNHNQSKTNINSLSNEDDLDNNIQIDNIYHLSGHKIYPMHKLSQEYLCPRDQSKISNFQQRTPLRLKNNNSNNQNYQYDNKYKKSKLQQSGQQKQIAKRCSDQKKMTKLQRLQSKQNIIGLKSKKKNPVGYDARKQQKYYNNLSNINYLSKRHYSNLQQNNFDNNRNRVLSFSQNRHKQFGKERNQTEDKYLNMSRNKIIINGRDIDSQKSKASSLVSIINHKNKHLYRQNNQMLTEGCKKEPNRQYIRNSFQQILFDLELNQIQSVQQSIVLKKSIAESSFKMETLLQHHQPNTANYIRMKQFQEMNITNQTLNSSENIIANRSSNLNFSHQSHIISNNLFPTTLKVNEQHVKLPKILQKIKDKHKNKIKKEQDKRSILNISSMSRLSFEKSVEPSIFSSYLRNNNEKNYKDKQDLQKTEITSFKDYDVSSHCQTVCEQSLKGFHELMQDLKQQIEFDDSFRQLKKWFNRITDHKKWQALQILLNNHSVTITPSQMNIIFSTCYQEENPFYTPRDQDYRLQDLVLSFKQAEEHWSSDVLHKYSLAKLQEKLFIEQNIDIFKRGFITIEDLVRYVNVQRFVFDLPEIKAEQIAVLQRYDRSTYKMMPTI